MEWVLRVKKMYSIPSLKRLDFFAPNYNFLTDVMLKSILFCDLFPLAFRRSYKRGPIYISELKNIYAQYAMLSLIHI